MRFGRLQKVSDLKFGQLQKVSDFKFSRLHKSLILSRLQKSKSIFLRSKVYTTFWGSINGITYCDTSGDALGMIGSRSASNQFSEEFVSEVSINFKSKISLCFQHLEAYHYLTSTNYYSSTLIQLIDIETSHKQESIFLRKID